MDTTYYPHEAPKMSICVSMTATLVGIEYDVCQWLFLEEVALLDNQELNRYQLLISGEYDNEELEELMINFLEKGNLHL